MIKITEEEYIELKKDFPFFSGIPGRWKTLDRIFDIEEGDTIIDGGAYLGDMSIYFSKKVGMTGRVYSFEPLIDNFLFMYYYIWFKKLNNVIPLPIALSDKKEIYDLFINKRWNNVSSIIKEFRKNYRQQDIIMRYTHTDKLYNIVDRYRINKIDYIWLNIEGAEIRALKGMKNTLMNNDCKIAISPHKLIINGEESNTSMECKKILKSYGYKTDDSKYPIYGEK